MESNIRGRAVLGELDVQRGRVGVEVQAARHAVVGALVGGHAGHAVGLEQAAHQQAADADVLGVPGGDAGRVAEVEALVPVGCGVENAVVAEAFRWVVGVDILTVQFDVVHLVLDRPLGEFVSTME